MTQYIKRGLWGIPVGIMMQQIFSLIASLQVNDGNFYPVTPFAIDIFGSELKALLLQLLFSSLIGFIYSATSLIWENNWSVTKQTVVVFCVYLFTMLPIAYIMRWLHPSLLGLLIYFSIFLLLFTLLWIVNYLNIKASIKRINEKIQSL